MDSSISLHYEDFRPPSYAKQESERLANIVLQDIRTILERASNLLDPEVSFSRSKDIFNQSKMAQGFLKIELINQLGAAAYAMQASARTIEEKMIANRAIAEYERQKRDYAKYE